MGTDAPGSGPAHVTDDITGEPSPRLGGTWVRVSPAPPGEPGYPARLELIEATPTSGRYVGRRGPTEKAFLLWDAGTWQWEPPGLLRLSTATDALAAYRAQVREPDLFIDLDELRLHYRRVA